MLSYTDRPMLYDGVPTFLGVTPAYSPTDLRDADAAIIGVPYLTPLFGFDADLESHGNKPTVTDACTFSGV